jgi:hypothetical protein
MKGLSPSVWFCALCSFAFSGSSASDTLLEVALATQRIANPGSGDISAPCMGVSGRGVMFTSEVENLVTNDPVHVLDGSVSDRGIRLGAAVDYADPGEQGPVTVCWKAAPGGT